MDTQKVKFQRITMTVKDYLDNWYNEIDCQPLAQRLPVTEGPEKREGIINLMLKGIDIGQITLVKNTNESLYTKDSLDGGHRKRYIHGFYNNKFTVNGKYYNQLDLTEKLSHAVKEADKSYAGADYSKTIELLSIVIEVGIFINNVLFFTKILL